MGELKSRTVAREEIHRTLEGILDLERLTSRDYFGRGDAAGFAGFAAIAGEDSAAAANFGDGIALRLLVRSGCSFAPGRGGWACLLQKQLDEMTDVREMIARGIADDPPAVASDPGVIRRGFNAELDELHDITSRGGRLSRRWKSGSGSGPGLRR